jgi:hypothetical protein
MVGRSAHLAGGTVRVVDTDAGSAVELEFKTSVG